MAKFTDLPQTAQIGIAAVVCIALAFGAYYLFTKPIQEANEKDSAVLAQKQAEIQQLEPFLVKVQDLDRQLQSLNQQLELQKRIVPDEKEVPTFITLVQGEAQKSGIEIRRYTSKPTATKEFYSEVPFEIDVDGPYYSVLDFYQRMGQLERIVNVSNVTMATVKAPNSARIKKVYKYEPTETVVANFTATTFYSVATPPPAAAPAAPAKK
jgi:type IV pilus assembly protein PilO